MEAQEPSETKAPETIPQDFPWRKYCDLCCDISKDDTKVRPYQRKPMEIHESAMEGCWTCWSILLTFAHFVGSEECLHAT